MRCYGIPAAGAALLMGTMAAAADGGPAPAPVEPVYERYDWSGIYVGAQGGWLWGQNEAFEIFTDDGTINDGPLPYDVDSYVAGGVIGLNLQTGSWVYGGEFDVEYTNVNGEWDWGNGNKLRKDINIMGSLRARVGLALDRILLYGTAGLAVGKVEMEAIDATLPEFVTLTGSETPFGWAAGGGVEVALFDHLSAGVEYRFTHLPDTKINGEIFEIEVGEEILVSDFTYSHTNDFHTVRARLVYRWGI